MLEEILGSISNYILSIGKSLTNFFDSVWNVLVYIYSILETLRFGLTTLLTSLFDIVSQVFSSGLF